MLESGGQILRNSLGYARALGGLAKMFSVYFGLVFFLKLETWKHECSLHESHLLLCFYVFSLSSPSSLWALLALGILTLGGWFPSFLSWGPQSLLAGPHLPFQQAPFGQAGVARQTPPVRHSIQKICFLQEQDLAMNAEQVLHE